MRKFIPAIVIFAAAGIATLATSTPAAAAHDYPWCVQGWGVDIPGDCSYRTYANAWLPRPGAMRGAPRIRVRRLPRQGAAATSTRRAEVGKS